jgi:hypothetical protein
MFSCENGPGIETVSNVSEFLEDTLNICDNDSVLVYLSEEGRFLLDGFITEPTNSCRYSLSVR